MEFDRTEARFSQQCADAVPRVEPLGIVLIGDDAVPDVQDDLARDRAVVVRGDFALPEGQVLRVDPFPAARNQMRPEPAAINDVQCHRSARRQRAPDRFEQRAIVGDMREVAERVAHEIDAVEGGLLQHAGARIAFEKRDLEAKGIGALACDLEKISRLIRAADPPKSALSKLKSVAALTAAQVQNPVMRRKPGGLDQHIDFGRRDGGVFDNVAVGHQVEGVGVEHRAPPFGRNVAYERVRPSVRR